MGIRLKQYLLTIIWFCGVLFASFMPSQNIPTGFTFFPNEDKVIHACMYLGLAFLFLFNSRKTMAVSFPKILLVVVVVSLIGGAIELLQPIAERTCDSIDFLANCTGAVVGGLGFAIYNRYRKI